MSCLALSAAMVVVLEGCKASEIDAERWRDAGDVASSARRREVDEGSTWEEVNRSSIKSYIINACRQCPGRFRAWSTWGANSEIRSIVVA